MCIDNNRDNLGEGIILCLYAVGTEVYLRTYVLHEIRDAPLLTDGKIESFQLDE